VALNKEIELISVLNEQERILDSMLSEQKRIHDCVVTKTWDGLERYVLKINELGTEFSDADTLRERLVEGDRNICLNPEVSEVLFRVRSKLVKSKVENDALSKYVAATREFITEVMDQCVAQQRSTVYTPKGIIKKGYAQSVVINTTF